MIKEAVEIREVLQAIAPPRSEGTSSTKGSQIDESEDRSQVLDLQTPVGIERIKSISDYKAYDAETLADMEKLGRGQQTPVRDDIDASSGCCGGWWKNCSNAFGL